MKVSIVYDGQCPICQRVIVASRLKSRTDELELYDARTLTHSVIQGCDVSQLDFNEGFAVIVDGKLHHGAEGAYMLAMLTQSSGMLFRIFKWLSQSPTRSQLTYPVLRFGRSILLWLLRIPKI